jgi:hypothetical protein
MDLRIVPVNTGFIQVDKGGTLTQGRGYGEKIYIPATAWYVYGGEEKVMVDTGMCETVALIVITMPVPIKRKIRGLIGP